LAAGQRVSVLIKTKDNTYKNYRLHANMAPVMFDYIPDDLELSMSNIGSFKQKILTNNSRH
jgi:hypothetical protein